MRPAPAKCNLKFGNFEFNSGRKELLKDGSPIPLPVQSCCILETLLDSRGNLVPREELCKRLWPDGTFVDFDQGLNAAIRRLREILGDSADDPKYIQTVHRRGYRLICDVTEVSQSESSESSSPWTTPLSKSLSRLVLWILLAALMAIMAGRALVRDKDSEAAFDVTPLTSLPGEEMAPSFSPYGERVAFAWSQDPAGKGDAFDLYVKVLGSEQAIRLTNHPSDWLSSSFSPDGTQIVFARKSDPGSGIFVIPAAGGPERKLADSAFTTIPFAGISWSPNGEDIVYSEAGTDQHQHLTILNLSSLHKSKLAFQAACKDAYDPSFSPDGHNVAFACILDVAAYAICTVNVETGRSTVLVRGEGFIDGPSWTKDGQWLLYSRNLGDGAELWAVSLSGARKRLIVGSEVSSPAGSRLSDKVAFGEKQESASVWRLDLADARQQPVNLIKSTRLQENAEYSPDGKRLVFESTRSGNYEIWLADADGENSLQLTHFKGPLTGTPHWAPDSQHVVFDSRAGGRPRIWVSDTATQTSIPVASGDMDAVLPVWSHDSKTIYFIGRATDGSSYTFKVASTGGLPIRVTSNPASRVQETADGKLYYSRVGSSIEVWVKDGARESKIDGIPALRFDGDWTAVDDGIYYIDRNPKSPEIRFLNLHTGSDRLVLRLIRQPLERVGTLSVSADGHWLLYSQIEQRESDLFLLQGLKISE